MGKSKFFRSPYGTKDLRHGFTLDMWMQLDSLEGGQVILDSRTESSQGFCLRTTEKGTVEISLNDGRTENRWECDPGILIQGDLHHVAVIVDGGPKIISFIIDGKFCDGGEFRQFGWGRFSPNLRGSRGSGKMRIHKSVKNFRLYNRALRISEIIGNFNADHPRSIGLDSG